LPFSSKEAKSDIPCGKGGKREKEEKEEKEGGYHHGVRFSFQDDLGMKARQYINPHPHPPTHPSI